MTNFNTSTAAQNATRTTSVMRFLTGTMDTWRQRQALKSLDDHMLCDIGKSYKAAKSEADKPLWNVPAHWLQ